MQLKAPLTDHFYVTGLVHSHMSLTPATLRLRMGGAMLRIIAHIYEEWVKVYSDQSDWTGKNAKLSNTWLERGGGTDLSFRNALLFVEFHSRKTQATEKL